MDMEGVHDDKYVLYVGNNVYVNEPYQVKFTQINLPRGKSVNLSITQIEGETAYADVWTDAGGAFFANQNTLNPNVYSAFGYSIPEPMTLYVMKPKVISFRFKGTNPILDDDTSLPMNGNHYSLEPLSGKAKTMPIALTPSSALKVDELVLDLGIEIPDYLTVKGSFDIEVNIDSDDYFVAYSIDGYSTTNGGSEHKINTFNQYSSNQLKALGYHDKIEYYIDFSIVHNSANASGIEHSNYISSYTDIGVYMCKDEPKSSRYNTPGITKLKHETTYHIACTAVQGMSIETDYLKINTAIWQKFVELEVARKNGDKLHYYQNHEIRNTTTDTLLRDKDGQCSAWTKFFLDCLKVHGFKESENYVTVRNIKKFNGGGVLVSKWDFPQGPTSLNIQDVYATPIEPIYNVNVPNSDISGSPQWRPEKHYWYYKEVEPKDTMPGQNNSTTPKSFYNHQFAKVDINEKQPPPPSDADKPNDEEQTDFRTFTDPSYGKHSPTDSNFGFSGYFYWVNVRMNERELQRDFDGNGTIDDHYSIYTVCLFKKHEVNWLKESYETY